MTDRPPRRRHRWLHRVYKTPTPQIVLIRQAEMVSRIEAMRREPQPAERGAGVAAS